MTCWATHPQPRGNLFSGDSEVQMAYDEGVSISRRAGQTLSRVFPKYVSTTSCTEHCSTPSCCREVSCPSEHLDLGQASVCCKRLPCSEQTRVGVNIMLTNHVEPSKRSRVGCAVILRSTPHSNRRSLWTGSPRVFVSLAEATMDQ